MTRCGRIDVLQEIDADIQLLRRGLAYAPRHGKIEMVMYLMESGCATKDSPTALRALSGRLDILQYLRE